jgi:hypothetical protein
MKTRHWKEESDRVVSNRHLESSRSGIGKFLVLVLLGSLFVGGLPGRTDAQSRDKENRRQFIDDLLQTLIDTELERRESRRSEQNTPRIAARIIDAPTQEMKRVRKILLIVSQDADLLTSQLNDDLNRVPGIRPYLGDMLKLRARTVVVAQKSMTTNDHHGITEDFRGLDRKWRMLSFQLSQLRNLDRETRQSIQRLNDSWKTLNGVFQIDPQLDRKELLRKTTALTADIRNLLEDIEVELQRSDGRNELLLEGRKIQQQARHVSNTIADRDDYDTISGEYKRFQKMWLPFAARLRPIENRYVDRSVRRVQQVDNSVHELLWLPQRLDRQQLLYLTDALKKEVDGFFVRASLKLLMELPDSELVLPTASEFYGVCENFIDGVSRGEDYASIVQDYQYIEEAWKSFSDVFRPLKSQSAQKVLNEVEQDIAALRESLQIQYGFDRKAALELAASLENLADHLEYDTKNWLKQRNLSYQDKALKATAVFAEAAHEFHKSIVNDADEQVLRRKVDQLSESWSHAHSYIIKCDTDERSHLLGISAKITPALVDFRTTLAL